MDLDRRGFLRLLLGGAATVVAAPIIKPKGFFSFFSGALWKPEPQIIAISWGSDKVYGYYPTLADIARRMPIDNQFAKISELLNEHNPVLDDIPWMPEIEMVTTHRKSLV